MDKGSHGATMKSPEDECACKSTVFTPFGSIECEKPVRLGLPASLEGGGHLLPHLLGAYHSHCYYSQKKRGGDLLGQGLLSEPQASAVTCLGDRFMAGLWISLQIDNGALCLCRRGFGQFSRARKGQVGLLCPSITLVFVCLVV